jgi:hypothetical protein
MSAADVMPPLTPAWLADELRHENMDEGPDAASNFLEDPTPAESLLVTLGRTDGDVEIILANDLDVYTMAHGLYNFAELGFTDKQADCFLHNTLTLGPLEAETAGLEASLVELKNRFARLGEDIDHRLTLVVLLDPTSSDTASFVREIARMQVEYDELEGGCEEVGTKYEMYKMEMETTRTLLLAMKKRVRLAVVGSRKPLRVPMLVRDLLRKYEVGDDEEGGL